MPDEPEPAELTEPTDVVAWLRALPVGTVLLDKEDRAWQLRQWSFGSDRGHVANWAWFGTNTRAAYDRFAEPRLRLLALDAPFRVLWTPGGAT